MISEKISVQVNPLLSILLVLTMLASAATALVAFWIGYTPFGLSWSSDAMACVETMEAPGQDLPEPPSVATRTWLPLGVVCAVDLDGDGRPTISAHQNLGATVSAIAACCIVILMCLWLVLGLLFPRRLANFSP